MSPGIARLLPFFIILCLVSVLVGANQVSWSQLRSAPDDAWLTLTASRLPRLAALVLTGVGLSVCDVILQHIVHNKFDEPATSGGLNAGTLGNPLLRQTHAWKNDRVIFADAQAWYITAASPSSVKRVIDDVIKGYRD